MTDSGEPVRSPRGFQSQSSITYDFQLLDDLQPEGASEDDQVIHYNSYNYIKSSSL